MAEKLSNVNNKCYGMLGIQKGLSPNCSVKAS